MKSRKRPLLTLATAACLSIFPPRAEAFLGIPGNIASENGYDNGGDEQVCWLGRSANAYNDVLTSLLGDTQPIDNPLMNFTAVGNVELYPTCPEGTSLNVYPPQDLGEYGAVTQRNYSFAVNGTLDLREWPTDLVVSADNNTLEAAIHIVLCELRTTGFCSPFVHYQTNATSETIAFGDLHGGNHVDSEFVIIKVVPDAFFEFQVEVPVRVNEPGIFSVVAGLLFFLSDIDNFPDPLYLASVAAIPENSTLQIMEFRNEPEILTTSNRAEIVSYVFIGLAGTAMLFLMFQLVKNRKDQVVMLTQGKFLVAMLFFGIIAMVGSIFFNPKNDLYCNMLGVMLVVPLHIFYSIILGRLWRINAVISPLLLLTLDKEQTFATRCVNFLNKMTTCQSRKKIRRKVTDAQLARVILLWASPQIILQILNWTLTPDEAQIIFNEDLTRGSTVCSGMYNNKVPEVLSAVFLVVQFLAMWVVARQSLDLPSLFNEAAVIFDVTLVSVIILAVATIVIIMTNGPSTSPTVQYVIGVLGTLAMILNASVKLVLPKLQMVWRGDTVIVTKLISDHQKEQRKKSSIIVYNEHDLPVDPKQSTPTTDDDDTSEGSSVVLVHTTVEESIDPLDLEEEQDEFQSDSIPLEPISEAIDSINSIDIDLSKANQNGALPHSAPNSNEFRIKGAMPRKRPTLVATPHSCHNFMRSRRTIVTGVEATASRKRWFAKGDGIEAPDSRKHLFTNHRKQLSGFKSMRTGMAAAIGSFRNLATDIPSVGKQQPAETFDIDYHPNEEEKIKITETEPPSRRLLLRMIDVQHLLKKVNQSVLAGMPVPREEWDLIREATIELGGVFDHDVEFDWDEAKAAPQDASAERRHSSASTGSTTRQRRLIAEKWK